MRPILMLHLLYVPLFRSFHLVRTMTHVQGQQFLKNLENNTMIHSVMVEVLRAPRRIVFPWFTNRIPSTRIDRDETTDVAWHKYLPVEGQITSKFGWRKDPFTGLRTFHKGYDIAAPWGSPVRSIASGVVTHSRFSKTAGNYIVIKHNKFFDSRYLHLGSSKVMEGQVVKAGQIIGQVGSTGRSTGAHLHFELLRKGVAIDPFSILTRKRETGDIEAKVGYADLKPGMISTFDSLPLIFRKLYLVLVAYYNSLYPGFGKEIVSALYATLYLESGFLYNVKNRSSSASGIMQWIRSTWNNVIDQKLTKAFWDSLSPEFWEILNTHTNTGPYLYLDRVIAPRKKDFDVIPPAASQIVMMVATWNEILANLFRTWNWTGKNWVPKTATTSAYSAAVEDSNFKNALTSKGGGLAYLTSVAIVHGPGSLTLKSDLNYKPPSLSYDRYASASNLSHDLLETV